MGVFSHFLEIGTSDWHNWHYYAKESFFCRFFQLWLVGKGLNIFPQRNFAYRRPLMHVKTYFLKFEALDWLDILQIMIEILAYFFLTIDNQMIIIFAYLFFVRWWDSRLESHCNLVPNIEHPWRLKYLTVLLLIAHLWTFGPWFWRSTSIVACLGGGGRRGPS